MQNLLCYNACMLKKRFGHFAESFFMKKIEKKYEKYLEYKY